MQEQIWKTCHQQNRVFQMSNLVRFIQYVKTWVHSSYNSPLNIKINSVIAVQCVFTNLQLSGNVVIIHVITAKKETDENGWVQCGWSQFWGFSPNQFSAGWLRIWLLFFGNGHWHNAQRATQVRGGSDVIVCLFYLNRGIHTRRKTPWRHDEAGISSVNPSSERIEGL